VAQGAGNLISKRKYQLDASGPAARMAFGTLLRAANMEIQVIDMATNQPLVLGQDAEKHDVLSIVTNSGGDFKVYLPEKLGTRNVRIAATAQGLSDDRLSYQTLTAFQASDATTLDEDTGLLARYVRGAFAARIERVFLDAAKQGSFQRLLGPDTPESLKTLISVIGTKVDDAAKAAHAENYTPEQRRYVALASADAILGNMNLEQVTVHGNAKLSMLGELRDVLHGFRDATARTMRGKARPAEGQGYFQDEAWLIEPNRALDPASRYVIQTPADLGEFCLRAILTSPDRSQHGNLTDVFLAVGYDPANYDRIQAAMTGLLEAIFGALIPPDENQDSPAMQGLLRAIQAGPPK
jgi:hypothetical protein